MPIQLEESVSRHTGMISFAAQLGFTLRKPKTVEEVPMFPGEDCDVSAIATQSTAMKTTSAAIKKGSRGPSKFASSSFPTHTISLMPFALAGPTIVSIPQAFTPRRSAPSKKPLKILEPPAKNATVITLETTADMTVENFHDMQRNEDLLPSRPVSPSSVITCSTDDTLTESDHLDFPTNAKSFISYREHQSNSNEGNLEFAQKKLEDGFPDNAVETIALSYLDSEMFGTVSRNHPQSAMISTSSTHGAEANKSSVTESTIPEPSHLEPLFNQSPPPVPRQAELGPGALLNRNNNGRARSFGTTENSILGEPPVAMQKFLRGAGNSAGAPTFVQEPSNYALSLSANAPASLKTSFSAMDSTDNTNTHPLVISRNSKFNDMGLKSRFASPSNLPQDSRFQHPTSSKSKTRKFKTSETNFDFSFSTACPTQSGSPRDTRDRVSVSPPSRSISSQSGSLKIFPSLLGIKSRVLSPTTSKLDSSVSSLPAVVGSGSNDSDKAQVGEEQPLEHNSDDENPSDLWSYFYKFASSTRNSDSLVYALARKEAFLQSTRIARNDKEPFRTIDLWVLMGLRYVMEGKLLFSPLAMCINKSNRNHIVLDLQGGFRDQWSWQVALDFPKAMVYGFKFANFWKRSPIYPPMDKFRYKQSKTRQSSIVTTTSSSSSSASSLPAKYDIDSQGFCRQDKKSYGPSNYIPCVGHSLTSMPFEDSTFDIVSAKSMWYFVKQEDWSHALKEFYRVLKPGGYIEFVVPDFYMVNSNDTDDYWWSRLREGVKRHGLQPFAGATLPHHLIKAGFKDVHKALVALPRGWGGQTGHLTHLLSLYYAESMFNTFSDLTHEELEEFKISSSGSPDSGHFPANRLTFIYARKES